MRTDAPLRTGKLSADEREEITRLAGLDLGPAQIGRRMRRHRGTINFAMIAMGLRSSRQRTFDYVRRGVRVCSFDADEDAFITALRVQGFGHTEIAAWCLRRFGRPRTPGMIYTRLMSLAARSETA